MDNINNSLIVRHIKSMGKMLYATDLYRFAINYILKIKKDRFYQFIENDTQVYDIDESFPPGDKITIENATTSLTTLLQLFTQQFFQFARSFYDYMSQIIAILYIGNNERRLYDFQKIYEEVNSHNTSYPNNLIDFVKSIYESENYKYLCDLNNTIKHDYAFAPEVYWDTITLIPSAEIPAFTKRHGRSQAPSHHQKTNLEKQIIKTRNDMVSHYRKFLEIIKDSKSSLSSGKE